MSSLTWGASKVELNNKLEEKSFDLTMCKIPLHEVLINYSKNPAMILYEQLIL